MHLRSKLAALVAASAFSLAACAPKEEQGNDRWATTEKTNVAIDWDKVNKAYQEAEGPEDLEKRVNEIYEGKEIISISVQDLDDKTQVVTGFFDKDENGEVAEEEKIFTIQRVINGEGADVQTSGHGPHYGYYHSPMMSMMSGMLMGAMLSSALSPGYSPMYRQAYNTPPERTRDLRSSRTAHRERTMGPKSSGNRGKSYGGGRSGGGGRRGGGRFGVRRPAGTAVVRLSA
jgi:hypothetical protein